MRCNRYSIIGRLRSNDPSLTIIAIIAGREISLHQFCSSVQENSTIKTLRIYDFDIGAVAANELSAALARMPFLERLIMNRCPWESVEVARTLVSSLAGRDTLQLLRLSDCNIDDGCVQAISTMCTAHQSLRTLGLQNNPIGNVGAIAIGSLIASNENIETVDLCRSNIGPDGFEAIARGIAQNRTLKWLDLIENAADLPSVQNAFKRALYNDDSIEAMLTGSNHTLNHLSAIGDAGIGNAGIKDADILLLLAMNGEGAEESRRKKLVRFLDETPGSLLSMGVHDTLLPNAIEKIGRVGGVSAMHELVRAMPDLFERKVSRKRSRS